MYNCKEKFSDLSEPVKSVKKMMVNEVLAKIHDSVKIQYKILNPQKSSIVPGCRHCKLRMKNYSVKRKVVSLISQDRPVFLKKLEHFIIEELKKNNTMKRAEKCDLECDHLLCNQKILDSELLVYRKAFELLLNKIKTFKPLLNRIKLIYDKCIEVRDDRLKLMDIVSSKLEEYKKRVEKKLETIQRMGTAEVYTLRNEKIVLTEKVAKLKADLEESNGKLNALRDELLKNEERGMRRIANSHKNKSATDPQNIMIPKNYSNRIESSEDKKVFEKSSTPIKKLADDPILMTMCLQRARKDLSIAHRKIAELEDTFRDVVPKQDLDRLENTHEAFKREYRSVSQELEALIREHETLKLNFEAVKEQKNNLRDRCKMLAHTNTPRPDWSKCGQFIQGGVQRWRDITANKSSEDRLMILLSELCGVATAENDYFVGKGIDQSVPVFLRYKGKMKNRKLGRREVSILINDLWKNRVMSSDTINIPMGDYILKYFTERYHLPLLRYEWIYNLYYACQRLVYDDQIGLFWNILWGNISEDAYHIPRKEFHALKKMMEMKMEDKKINALLAQDIMNVVNAMFPHKSNRDIENTVYAAAKQLGIDPSTEAFDIEKLFAQTEEGWERGEFARELARQTTEEITEFGKAILRRIDIWDNNSKVSVEMLKKGFLEVDEGISQALVTQYLKWIYKVQDLSKATPMPSSTIIRQMLNGYIRRSHHTEKQPKT